MPFRNPTVRKESLFNIGDTLFRPKAYKQNGKISITMQMYKVTAREIYTDKEDYFYKFRSEDGISEICISETRFLNTPFKELFASEQEAIDYIKKGGL